MKPVRTRFAPSPTGYLHVGGIRTALFAWLVARQAGGEFILRIEDTDQAREVEGSAAHIQESLGWLGLGWDEGPDYQGESRGSRGPYFQSQRLDTYQRYAKQLIAAGRAYADPYTPEEVQKFRDDARAAKKPFLYRDHRPENPAPWDGTTPLRFKSEPKEYQWHDAVMGDLHVGADVVDDFILIKSDGFPTYNFAHIVDDHEMEITHVIRGQEFVASTPNYLNLYEALGIEQPILATMPHILGPSGTKKLSKRDGAKDILDYREEGYLPEAMINFLATMGWNDGTPQEKFSVEELIQKFSLDHVQKSNARFDERRLLWLEGEHIRDLPPEKLLNIVGTPERGGTFWPKGAFDAPYTPEYRLKVISVVQERLKFFKELRELSWFFFEEPPVKMELIDDNKQLKKFTHAELHSLLEQVKTSLEASDFTTEDITERLNTLLEQTGQKPGILFSLVRIVSTWAPASPNLAGSLHVLGKDVSLQRIEVGLKALTEFEPDHS